MSIYLVLLVDRKRARMFILRKGVVKQDEEIIIDSVPQKVKHGDDTWDAQDKIFRHIEDHLHRHLKLVAEKVSDFAKKKQLTGIVIGSHKPLFIKIEKHLQYPLNRKVKGKFVTELKAPFGEILKRAKRTIKEIEEREKSL